MSKNLKSRPKFDEIIFLKVLIIFVIALIPLSFMLLNLSNTLFGAKTASRPSLPSIGSEENFKVVLPASASGDISQVSKDKIDSLFNNLKH